MHHQCGPARQHAMVQQHDCRKVPNGPSQVSIRETQLQGPAGHFLGLGSQGCSESSDWSSPRRELRRKWSLGPMRHLPEVPRNTWRSFAGKQHETSTEVDRAEAEEYCFILLKFSIFGALFTDAAWREKSNIFQKLLRIQE